ncbi:Disulfide-bond oxidoreductase YfcG [Nymphon striatum]|nr:Disulfide-bond oxidoreductase YfcG [Nymphon striatum]
MAGQTHHFRVYAPENVPYAIDRYTNEVNRLYGVLNKRLAGRDFIAGEYSIADMACIGWAQLWERQGQDIQQFPNLEKWIERMKARPAVAAGLALGLEKREQSNFDKDKDQQAVLFELLGDEWIPEKEMKRQSAFAREHNLLLVGLRCKFNEAVKNPGREDVLFRADFKILDRPEAWGWTFEANATLRGPEQQAKAAGFVVASEEYFEANRRYLG